MYEIFPHGSFRVENGSLKMITAYLGEYHPPEELQNIMVMDIGGTNVRAKMNGLSYEFHTVPDVILRGTAVACLSG